MVSAGPMDNCELELLKGVQPSSHHPLCIFKPVKPDKRLVVRPNNESSTAQVGAKLYTHGDGRQHLSFCGAVSTLRRPESMTAVRNDPFLAILDLARYSTQAKITSICIQHVVPGLSRKCHQRFRNVSKTGDKPPVVPHKSQELAVGHSSDNLEPASL